MKLARFAMLLGGVVLILGGCAVIERQAAPNKERLLAAAGFQTRPISDLASVAPFEIVAQRQGANTEYVYADPDTCRCVYVGSPEAYARFRRLEASITFAEARATASANSGP